MLQEPTSRRPSDPACILIAEDHIDSRETLRLLLESTGYRVLIAVDGRHAVAVARAERPDLILMDIMMPEVDGFEATRLLRRDRVLGRVPIIAVTAMIGARTEALEAGADAVVAKPVDIEKLLSTIQDLLLGRES